MKTSCHQFATSAVQIIVWPGHYHNMPANPSKEQVAVPTQWARAGHVTPGQATPGQTIIQNDLTPLASSPAVTWCTARVTVVTSRARG